MFMCFLYDLISFNEAKIGPTVVISVKAPPTFRWNYYTRSLKLLEERPFTNS